MTIEELIRMAREAGLMAFKYPDLISKGDWENLERFAALVSAAEREACAKVCEEYETENDITATWLNIIATAIRARGQA